MEDLSSLHKQIATAATVKVIRPASNARPEVRYAVVDGVAVVIKDFSVGGNTFKRLLGRFLVARERAAYNYLEGMEGVPRCLGVANGTALVTERLQAWPTARLLPPDMAPEYLAKLRKLVDAMHRRGVAHGDMHKLDNILIDDQGNPVLVDFAASFVTGSNPLAALIFPLLVEDDLRGIIKLKRAVVPELLTPEEVSFLDRRRGAERFFRSWRDSFRNAVKKWSKSAEL